MYSSQTQHLIKDDSTLTEIVQRIKLNQQHQLPPQQQPLVVPVLLHFHVPISGNLSESLMNGLKRVLTGPSQIVFNISSTLNSINLGSSVNRIYTVLDGDLYTDYQEALAAARYSHAFIERIRNPINKFDGMMQILSLSLNIVQITR